MNLTKINTILLVNVIILLGAVTFVYADQNRVINKIVLGTFQIKNNDISYTSPIDPKWQYVDRFKIAIDNNEYIYLLNKRNNSVIEYDSHGNKINEIILHEKINKAKYLQVSSGGDKFIVVGYPKSFIFDKKGRVIKTVTGVVPELRRLCNGTYVDRYGQVIYDGDLNIIKKGSFQRFAEQYNGDLDFPDQLQFTEKFWTQADWSEMEGYASEEPFEFYKQTCKGNIFVIFALHLYPTNAYRRWLKGGEYFIYKIKFNNNSSASVDVINIFKDKKYKGDKAFYKEEDLRGMWSNKNDIEVSIQKLLIKTLRNEIFARHGRTFQSDDLRYIFENTDWYKPNPNYSDNMLNDIERKNIQFILEYEKKKGWR